MNDFRTRLELCDEAGETVGFFVPVSEHQKLLYAWARNAFKDEEIELARQEPGGFAISEILEDLRRQ